MTQHHHPCNANCMGYTREMKLDASSHSECMRSITLRRKRPSEKLEEALRLVRSRGQHRQAKRSGQHRQVPHEYSPVIVVRRVLLARMLSRYRCRLPSCTWQPRHTCAGLARVPHRYCAILPITAGAVHTSALETTWYLE
jgi:hypothetical protein